MLKFRLTPKKFYLSLPKCKIMPTFAAVLTKLNLKTNEKDFYANGDDAAFNCIHCVLGR